MQLLQSIGQFSRRLFTREGSDSELLLSTSRNVILTVGVIYGIWHFTATLIWPRAFSPSMWIVTAIMAVATGTVLWLLPRNFSLAIAAWFLALFVAVLTAYHLYQQPGIPLLLCFLPLMAATMIGLRGAFLVLAVSLALATGWVSSPFLPSLPAPYSIALVLLSLGMAFLGWGLSTNLLSAIEASSYHYRLALQHLEEARQHRAEISVLNKELSKSNFQLDRLNRMLTIARAQAEEAREERDRFAMSVSHELRSPLNFIIGFSDLMVNAPHTYAPIENWPAGLYEDIQEVYRSSMHLHGLINDILDMGKLEARQMVLFREKTQLGDIIESVRSMAEPAAAKKSIWLRVEIEPNLPALHLDRTRLRQVLINLITNALRFTDQGGITIRARSDGPDWVRVEVIDTGAGIAEEDIPKIFSEFRQVGNENWRRKEGTGLGLAIGQRFIQLHGGEMAVESEVGRGSCFSFTLPTREPGVFELDAASNEETLEWVQEAANQAERSPLLVFFTTDPFWAQNFGEQLTGYKVMLAATVDSLRQACDQLYPKAILVDRPLLDDPGLQEFLANPPYDLPVLVFPLPVNINRVTNLPEGVVRYLVKPVARETLVEAVEALGAGVRRLLVIDDEPAMVRFVEQAVHAVDQAGPARYELLVAGSGAQAIELLREQSIDAVLLDLELPDMGGLDVLAYMQSDPGQHAAPVLIVSANDLPHIHERGQAGRLEVLRNRPFARQELAELITGVLAKTSTVY